MHQHLMDFQAKLFQQVYEGRDPQIFACDPELIRLITVKDAQYFDAKRLLEFNDPMLNEMPDFLPGFVEK